MHYGQHVSIDGVCARSAFPILNDPKLLGEALQDIVKRIGMRILAGPLSKYEDCENAWNRGASSVIILYESHVAIHGYPARGRFFFDLFSCKPFDTSVVLSFLKQKLSMEVYIITERSRGEDWEIDEAEDRLTAQRASRRLHENINSTFQL